MKIYETKGTNTMDITVVVSERTSQTMTPEAGCTAPTATLQQFPLESEMKQGIFRDRSHQNEGA